MSIPTFYTSCSTFSFFFNAPSPTETYTLSLHDALPISDLVSSEDAILKLFVASMRRRVFVIHGCSKRHGMTPCPRRLDVRRSEEHTSELQSHSDLVCRLLLEKKKITKEKHNQSHNTILR